MQIDSLTLGRQVKAISDVHIDFPADENSAPDFAILREDAQWQGKRYGSEDVQQVAEVVSVSSARKDYDDCMAKYGRYGIPVYVVVDPHAAEVVVRTRPTGSGRISAHTHKYGSGKLPIEPADGRTSTVDLGELPRLSWTPADRVAEPGLRLRVPEAWYACVGRVRRGWCYRSARRRNCQPSTARASVCTIEMSTSRV